MGHTAASVMRSQRPGAEVLATHYDDHGYYARVNWERNK